jgi:DUF4097 and DUF4098 domain-containing protein YvlB
MKKPLSTIAIGFLLICAGCVRIDSAETHGDLRAKAIVTQTNAIPNDIKELEVDNSFGPVGIMGVDDGSTECVWTLTAHAETDALAQEAASAAKFETRREGDRLRILVTLPTSRNNRSYNSNLQIQVPRSISVWTRTTFGKTAVTKIAGDVEASGQHGSMDIRDIKGSVRAKTSFGSLRVGRSGAATLENQHGEVEVEHITGPADVETSFGKIEISHVTGPVKLRNQHGSIVAGTVGGDAELTTSFGSLVAREVSGNASLENQHGSIEAKEIKGSLRATTSFANLDVEGSGSHFVCRNSHGSIRLRSPSAELSDIDAETSFASIDLRLAEELQPAIQARTSFGEIESDFPVLMKPRGTDPFAELAADKPRVRLENQHGSIRIVRD